MSVITSDTFADVAGTTLQAHTGATGATWIHSNGYTSDAVITAANRLRGNGSNATYSASGSPGANAQDLECDVYVASLVNNAGIMFAATGTGTDTKYLFDFSSGNTITLYVVVAGSVPASTAASFTFVPGTTYRARAVWRTGFLALLINGVQVLSLVDSNISFGGHAGVFFAVADSDSTGFHFANLILSTPPAATAVTSSNLQFSPYTWRSDGSGTMQANNILPASTYAETVDTGAYVKSAATAVANGLLTLVMDTSMLSGITAANCPTLAVTIDGLPATNYLLAYAANPMRVQIASGLSAASHNVRVDFKSVDLTSTLSMGNRWNDPPNAAVKITGMEVDGRGTTLTAPAVLAKNILVYSDSNAEGADANGTDLTNNSNDITLSWPVILAQQLITEYGTKTCSGQGWGGAYGYGNVPKLIDTVTPANSTWNLYWAGKSMLISGRLSPAPSIVIAMLGVNDFGLSVSDAVVTIAVSTWIAGVRAAAPLALIVVFIPMTGEKRTAINQGVTNAADTNLLVVDMGVAAQPYYAVGGANVGDAYGHPSGLRGHPAIAAYVVGQIATKLGGGGGGGGIVTGFAPGVVCPIPPRIG
jgi:hypothetical protein